MKHSGVLFLFVSLSLLFSACNAAPALADCAREDIFCVGLVTDIDGLNDQAENQSAWQAIQKANTRLDAQVYYIESIDARDYAVNIAYFAAENVDVIVTVGAGMLDETVAAAWKYPQVKFIGVDQWQPDIHANLAGALFHEDQAGFLAGALAVNLTATKSVGGIFASEGLPSLQRLAAGFQAGVQHADPVARVSIAYNDEFDIGHALNDPAWSTAKVAELASAGTDVFFASDDSTGDSALAEAGRSKTCAIGFGVDKSLTLPESSEYIAASIVKEIEPLVLSLVTQAQEGSFTGGNTYGSWALAMGPGAKCKISPAVQEKLEKIRTDLENGTLQTGVFFPEQ